MVRIKTSLMGEKVRPMKESACPGAIRGKTATATATMRKKQKDDRVRMDQVGGACMHGRDRQVEGYESSSSAVSGVDA